MKRALFPGSFDPITLGHYDIIKRALDLFDEIVVAIGVNGDKNYMFTVEQRKEFIEKAFADEPKVKVTTYQGLTVDFCKEIDAQFILRGLRNPADFEFEKAIAHTKPQIISNRNCLFTYGSTHFVYIIIYCARCYSQSR